MPGEPTPVPRYEAPHEIVHLEPYECVRRRPGMYIGDTRESGLHHMAQEIISNALAEVHQGYGSRVTVEILRSGGLRVRDEGRGISVDPMPTGGKHLLEMLCTVRGGDRSPPWPAGGLHGIGLVASNALSRRFVVEVRREGFRWRQTFSRGQPTSSLQRLGLATKTGTTVALWPDPQIFSCLDFNFFWLRIRLEELAMLLPRLRVRLVDHRVAPPLVSVIHWPDGLLTGLEVFGRGRQAVHSSPVHGSTRDGDTSVSVAFRWQHADTLRVWSLCNGMTTPSHGTHVSGFYRGVTRALHRSPLGRLRNLSGEDLRAGLVAIVSADSANPHFAGSTKERVANEEFDALTAALTDRLLAAFLAEHPDEADAIARHLEAPPTIDPKTGM